MSVDGLSGFVGAIHAAFPQTEVQRCGIHHQIWAATEESALAALDDLEAKWGGK